MCGGVGKELETMVARLKQKGFVFGKKLQTFAANALGKNIKNIFAPSKELFNEGVGLTAVEKIFIKNSVGTSGKILHAGSYVRVR